MSDFTTALPENKLLDPNKRVNYIHGLVLGVDEFKQEEYYLLEKDRLHNRALHGYGTVCGLSVSQADAPSGLQIKVDPGIAISHSGQVIQVPHAQCATLDEWLSSHNDEVLEALGSPPSGPLTLYLMLCYRECPTDLVPIPTGPCQSLEESSAPSRIVDDFSLSFELEAPSDDHFEMPMQSLSDLLLSIPVEVGGTMTVDDIKSLVRSLIPQGSPASPSDGLGSPAIGEAMAPENVDVFFRAAYLVWVTEVKPCLLKPSATTNPSERYHNCVFLAQLNINVETIDGVVRIESSTEQEIDEQFRRFLISSQSLQNHLGSLSSWMKSMMDLPSPDVLPPPGPDTMNLSDDQVITGSKTFNAPIILGGDGRVRKNIILPANQAFRRLSVASVAFNGVIPGVRFPTTGTNAFRGQTFFDLPIPDDVLFSSRFQFRLMWGFQGTPPGAEINFNWNIEAQTFAANAPVSNADLQGVTLAASAPASRRNSVILTDFRGFASGVRFNQNSRQGVIRIGVERTVTGATPAIFLLQVELQYVANRLGRRM